MKNCKAILKDLHILESIKQRYILFFTQMEAYVLYCRSAYPHVTALTVFCRLILRQLTCSAKQELINSTVSQKLYKNVRDILNNKSRILCLAGFEKDILVKKF
jgi:hypothetical protein